MPGVSSRGPSAGGAAPTGHTGKIPPWCASCQTGERGSGLQRRGNGQSWNGARRVEGPFQQVDRLHGASVPALPARSVRKNVPESVPAPSSSSPFYDLERNLRGHLINSTTPVSLLTQCPGPVGPSRFLPSSRFCGCLAPSTALKRKRKHLQFRAGAVVLP